MKRMVLLGSIFTVGFVLGGVVTVALASYTYPMHRRLIRTELTAEEDFRVYRARRHGHQLESIVHAWNAARLADDRGFRTFSPEYGNEADGGLLIPLRLVVLDRIGSTSPESKGPHNAQAVARAVLARSLEVSGFPHEAEEQWALAASLIRRPDSSMLRTLAESLENIGQSQVGIAAETVVLGPDPADATEGLTTRSNR